MTNKWKLFLLMVLAMGCSGVDPVADCLQVCEHRRDEMCRGYTADEDCDARCADAEESHEEIRARAEAAGCTAEFEASYACGVHSGDTCIIAVERCPEEVEAYSMCVAGP